MNYKKVTLMLLIAVSLLLPGSSLCQAVWQPVQLNGYTYYVYGDDRAYNFTSQYGTIEWYYQIHYDQSILYEIPLTYADPTRDTYQYVLVNPITNQIWVAQDGQVLAEVTNPDLVSLKNYYDEQYNNYLANPENPYYYAKYIEADNVFRVAKAIALRNTTTQISGNQ